MVAGGGGAILSALSFVADSSGASSKFFPLQNNRLHCRRLVHVKRGWQPPGPVNDVLSFADACMGIDDGDLACCDSRKAARRRTGEGNVRMARHRSRGLLDILL